MSAGKRCGKSTIVLKGYGNMKVYVVTEYGGSYDDSWDHIIGIFTDKDKAEEVKETYWTHIERKQEEMREVFNKYKDTLNIDSEDNDYWTAVNKSYDLDDISGVKLDEYPLDEFLGGYYNG